MLSEHGISRASNARLGLDPAALIKIEALGQIATIGRDLQNSIPR